LACAAWGCTHAQAKATPAPPPLDVPQPPPRIVQPTDADVPPPGGLVGDTTPSTPRPRTPTPAAKPEPAGRPEAAKPEPPPAETSKPPEEPRQQPPTTLTTTPSQREGEVEARIRAQLARATTDLSRVNYQTLGADARGQYDAAKGFVTQAEGALKARNLLFAQSLAEKAATLAAQLAGR
jgi:hypothetical protein